MVFVVCGEFLCERAVGKAWASQLEGCATTFQGSVLKFRGRGENKGKSEGIGGYTERNGLKQGEGLGGEREKKKEYWERFHQGEIENGKDGGGKQKK